MRMTPFGIPSVSDNGYNYTASAFKTTSTGNEEQSLNYKILKTALALVSIKNEFIDKTANKYNVNIKVKLEEEKLWAEFHHVTNEMIITKSGRCLFPTLKYSFMNFKSNVFYAIGIDFVMVGYGKYKFKGSKKGWYNVTTGISNNNNAGDCPESALDCMEADLRNAPITEIYEYPESPRKGEYWNKHMISFTKLKLTNRFPSIYRRAEAESEYQRSKEKFQQTNNYDIIQNIDGMFSLHSFHKYVPRLHIVELGEEITERPSFSSNFFPLYTVVFPETVFIAVTHYQNNSVNILKKNYNPHAKGFKDGSSSSSSSQNSYYSIGQLPLSTLERQTWKRSKNSHYTTYDSCGDESEDNNENYEYK